MLSRATGGGTRREPCSLLSGTWEDFANRCVSRYVAGSSKAMTILTVLFFHAQATLKKACWSGKSGLLGRMFHCHLPTSLSCRKHSYLTTLKGCKCCRALTQRRIVALSNKMVDYLPAGGLRHFPPATLEAAILPAAHTSGGVPSA